MSYRDAIAALDAQYVEGGMTPDQYEIERQAGLTIAEHKAGKQAESAGYWAQRFAQNPQGKPAKQAGQASGGGGQYGGYAADPYPQSQGGNYGAPDPEQYDDFDDEIPF